MKKVNEINWLPEPDDKAYLSAESYLSLLNKNKDVKAIIAKLKKSPISQFHAKDVFRASGLSLLGVSNSHVEKECKKIEEGKNLAPILLVKDEVNRKLLIANGYHRLCAVYTFYEDAFIPCKIV